MATAPTVPDFSQYNYEIGDTAAVVVKQNGVNSALLQFGNSLTAMTDSINTDLQTMEQQKTDTQQAASTASTAAGTATTKAGEAANSASAADGSASTANTAAGTATTKAGEAASSASAADGSASTASTAAGTASDAAVASVQAKNDAQALYGDLQAVENAKTASQQAAQNAGEERALAVTAREGAEGAQAAAEQAVQNAEYLATRAVTQTLTAPPTIRNVDTWSIDASAISRHVSGSIAAFEVTWWDSATETIAASGGSATLPRAVDQPVGGTVSATVRALDDIGNASAPETVSADVIANSAPVGPIAISAPTQTGKNSTFQVSFSGASDPDGDPVTYTVTDTGTFTFAKTAGIAEGEVVEVTAPDVTADASVAFSVVAVDSLGAQSAAYSETVTVLAAQVIGVALRATGGPGGTFDHIDEAGNTIASPSTSWFNGHPVFGGMQDVTVDGQVMVEVPKFYYKRGTAGGDPAWWISDQPLIGFTIMPAFVLDGVEVSSFQVGKYQASLSGGKLQSVSGVSPVVSRSLTQFLADAEARNVSGVAGFRLWHYDMWLAIQWLYLIENATMDSQTKTGEGRVNESSAAAVDAADVAQATYRGIVGLWGNVYQWMDGVRTLSSVIERRAYNGSWVSTGEVGPNGGSPQYPITFRSTGDESWIANTFSTSSDSTATLPDYRYWRSGGEYYPFVGGYWSLAATAGLWYVNCYLSASIANPFIGGRLARVVS